MLPTLNDKDNDDQAVVLDVDVIMMLNFNHYDYIENKVEKLLLRFVFNVDKGNFLFK